MSKFLVEWFHCAYGTVTEFFSTMDAALVRVKELSTNDEAIYVIVSKTPLAFNVLKGGLEDKQVG
jgi:hypothetical protein